MIYPVIGSYDNVSSLRTSVCLEAIPLINQYRYASAWPRYFGVETVKFSVELDPKVAAAAAAIIKVSSWSNGIIKSNDPRIKARQWDTDTVPTDLPSQGVETGNNTWSGTPERLPVYNCASLAVFAAGVQTLHAMDSPINWKYTPTDIESTGILRLVPPDLDPTTYDLSDGHWMIGLGTAKEILTMPNEVAAKANISEDEPLVLHVQGGDGALLMSSAKESYEYWCEMIKSQLAVYTANP